MSKIINESMIKVQEENYHQRSFLDFKSSEENDSIYLEKEESAEGKSHCEDLAELESANMSRDLRQNLELRRKSFLDFMEKSNTPINIKEIEALLKKPFVKFPKNNKEIMEIYSRYAKRSIEEESSVNKKRRKKWSDDESIILTCVIFNFLCASKTFTHPLDDNQWHEVSLLIPSRSALECKIKWSYLGRSHAQTTNWSKEEDMTLQKILLSQKKSNGKIRWNLIAKDLYEKCSIKIVRLGRHCRERWINHLNPSLKKDEWTRSEDINLIKNIMSLGGKWAQISRNMIGRSENSVKNRIYCIFNKLKLSPKNEEIDFSDAKVRKTLAELLQKMENNLTYVELEAKIWKKKKKRLLSLASETSSLNTNGFGLKGLCSPEEFALPQNAKLESKGSAIEPSQCFKACASSSNSGSIQGIVQANIQAASSIQNEDALNQVSDFAQSQILLQAQQNPQQMLFQQITNNQVPQFANGSNPRIIGMLPQGAIIINNTSNMIPIKQGVFDTVNRTLSFPSDNSLIGQLNPYQLNQITGLLSHNSGSNGISNGAGLGHFVGNQNGFGSHQKDLSSLIASQLNLLNNENGGNSLSKSDLFSENFNIKVDDVLSASKLAANGNGNSLGNGLQKGSSLNQEISKPSSFVFSVQHQPAQALAPGQGSQAYGLDSQTLGLLWQQLQQQQTHNLILQFQIQQHLEQQKNLQLLQQQQQQSQSQRILQLQNASPMMQQNMLGLNLQQQLSSFKSEGYGGQGHSVLNPGISNGNSLKNSSLMGSSLLGGGLSNGVNDIDLSNGGAQHKYNLLNQVAQQPSAKPLHQMTTHISLQYNNQSNQMAHEINNVSSEH